MEKKPKTRGSPLRPGPRPLPPLGAAAPRLCPLPPPARHPSCLRVKRSTKHCACASSAQVGVPTSSCCVEWKDWQMHAPTLTASKPAVVYADGRYPNSNPNHCLHCALQPTQPKCLRPDLVQLDPAVRHQTSDAGAQKRVARTHDVSVGCVVLSDPDLGRGKRQGGRWGGTRRSAFLIFEEC